METHSSLFIRQLQILVAKRKVSPANIALYWALRNEDGSTEFREGNLDSKGAYGDWPQDFDSNDLETETEYLDAVEEGSK